MLSKDDVKFVLKIGIAIGVVTLLIYAVPYIVVVQLVQDAFAKPLDTLLTIGVTLTSFVVVPLTSTKINGMLLKYFGGKRLQKLMEER